MNQTTYRIGAIWDAEAQVWFSTSEDVPGLTTEADSLDILMQKLRDMVPELLQLNNIIPSDQTSTIAIDLTSHRQELIQVAA